MVKDEFVDFDVKDLIEIMKKKFYIVFILMFLCVGGVILHNKYFTKNVYVATSSIIVGGETVDTNGRMDNESLMAYQSLLKTYSSIAKTNIVAEKTIQILGVNMSTDQLKSRISATPRPDTQIIDITVTSLDKEEAYELINTLSGVFMEQIKTIYSSSNIQLLDRIEKPKGPVSNIKHNILIAATIAIVLSFVIIGIMERLDHSIKTEKDVNIYLEMPTIGVIPKEKKKIENIGRKTFTKFNTELIEEFRILRTNVEHMCRNKNIKVIAITSFGVKEGKSTTAAFLATAMAQSKKKVMLIDADLRQSNIHNIFNISNKNGLSNVLLGDIKFEESIQEEVIENLDILTAGVKPLNPSELISDNIMVKMIDELKTKYDYIIMDTTTVGVVTDAQIIAQLSDGCLIVVAAGKTNHNVAIKSKELLRYTDVDILGVTLNKAKQSSNAKKYAKHYKIKNNNKSIR